MDDITLLSVNTAIDELRLRGGTRKHQEEPKPASNGTIQSYVRAIKGFYSWFCMTNELPNSTLVGLSAPDPSKTRKHVRRAMRIEEWRVLEASTKAGPDRRGVSGPERALTYAVMLATGYRKEETRKLTRGSLQRAGGSWALTLAAKHTKNGNAATQRIPDGLAAKLHQHTATKLPAAPLLSMVEPFGVVRVLREDLAAARESWIKEMETDKERENREQSDFLTYEDHQGRKLDVHALRHTCGHWLTEAGVKLSDVCAIMRHSSIKLTVDTYGHIEPGVMDEAAVKMGDALKVSS